jgi:hypothetical protein
MESSPNIALFPTKTEDSNHTFTPRSLPNPLKIESSCQSHEGRKKQIGKWGLTDKQLSQRISYSLYAPKSLSFWHPNTGTWCLTGEEICAGKSGWRIDREEDTHVKRQILYEISFHSPDFAEGTESGCQRY